MNRRRWAWVFGMVAAVSVASAQTLPQRDAQGRLVDADGHALYVYDNDTSPGQSLCTGPCAVVWPPFAAPAGAAPAAGLGVIARSDGSRQWSWHGHPLYRYAGDAKAGDARGDGINGTWHWAR